MQITYDLEPGDKLTVREELTDPDGELLEIRIRECRVIKEYPYFILADFGAYRESINKANIHCRAVEVWRGWKDE